MSSEIDQEVSKEKEVAQNAPPVSEVPETTAALAELAVPELPELPEVTEATETSAVLAVLAIPAVLTVPTVPVASVAKANPEIKVIPPSPRASEDADTFLAGVSSLLEYSSANLAPPSLNRRHNTMSTSSSASSPSSDDLAILDGIDLDQQIKLRVGNSIFRTTIRTLRKSNFFANYFDFKEERRSHDDGAYFVDTNGEAFEHVLSFLRHRTAPLFWNHKASLDHAAYAALRTSAIHFQVWDLVTWIDDKKYLRVVERDIALVNFISDTTSTGDRFGGAVQAHPTTVSSNIVYMEPVTEPNVQPIMRPTRRSMRLSALQGTIFHCPRNIPEHQALRSCGARCRRSATLAPTIAPTVLPGVVPAFGQGKVYRVHVEMQHVDVNLAALVVPEDGELPRDRLDTEPLEIEQPEVKPWVLGLLEPEGPYMHPDRKRKREAEDEDEEE